MFYMKYYNGASERGGGGFEESASLQPPPKWNLKKHRYCIHNDIKVLRDLSFSLNQQVQSADD